MGSETQDEGPIIQGEDYGIHKFYVKFTSAIKQHRFHGTYVDINLMFTSHRANAKQHKERNIKQHFDLCFQLTFYPSLDCVEILPFACASSNLEPRSTQLL